ncbi:MAG: TolC family protein [Verrucomicrobia bacterium]|nr:TolC family protein [Verrucomicrobiota bacterium]
MRQFLFLWLILPGWIALADPGFTADSAVARALSHNAELAAARLTAQEAQGRLENSGRLRNPELGTEFKPSLQGQEGTFRVGLGQRFPLTSRLRLEKAVSQRELAAARAEIRDVERRLAAQTRTLVLELAALEARRQLRDQQGQTVREWQAQAAQTATRGEGLALEAEQLALQLGELRLAERRAEGIQESKQSELRLLLGLDPAAPIEVREALSRPSITETNGVVVAQRGDFQAAQERVAAAQQTSALVRAERWQDLGVGVFGEWEREQDVPVGIPRNQFVGLELFLPLPFWNQQEGRIREADAAAVRESLQTMALANRIESETVQALRQMAAAADAERELFETLIPAARSLDQRLLALQREGQDTWSQRVRAGEKLWELESLRLDALLDYHLARTRWLSASGLILHPTVP